MKQYNHDYLNRKNLKSEDIKQDKPLKNIELNYIFSDEEYYIINVNIFITNFEDLEIINI